jgi:Protein of unknown function (DUF2934)
VSVFCTVTLTVRGRRKHPARNLHSAKGRHDAIFPQLGTGRAFATYDRDFEVKGGNMQTRLSPAHPDAGKLSFAELEDRIRERAFKLYERGGYTDGHALDDWLEAKAEVLGVTKAVELTNKKSAA